VRAMKFHPPIAGDAIEERVVHELHEPDNPGHRIRAEELDEEEQNSDFEFPPRDHHRVVN
jgi:hypothetical protein